MVTTKKTEGQAGELKNCPPMDSILKIMSGPWTGHLLWVLSSQGPQRFGALRRAIPGISSKVLTERLRRLEGAALIYREYNPTIPPEVTYGLTEKGKDLSKVYQALWQVVQRWETKAEDKAA